VSRWRPTGSAVYASARMTSAVEAPTHLVTSPFVGAARRCRWNWSRRWVEQPGSPRGARWGRLRDLVVERLAEVRFTDFDCYPVMRRTEARQGQIGRGFSQFAEPVW
jgi:hypothetical protein